VDGDDPTDSALAGLEASGIASSCAASLAAAMPGCLAFVAAFLFHLYRSKQQAGHQLPTCAAPNLSDR